MAATAEVCRCGRAIASAPQPRAEDGSLNRWPLNLATLGKRKIFVRGLIFGLGSGTVSMASAWWSSAGFPLGPFG
ncbi:hypothetical protein C1I97_17765 [Streptomyces sp. NTH33]|nr:hypothetical protein C1I97_17765 [Streptomyces sp. NTH33]